MRAIYGEQFNTAIFGIINMAFAYFNVLEVGHRFSSHLNACLIAFQAHAGDHNILTGHFAGGCFEYQRIITAYHITICYRYILAAIDTNAVIMCYANADDLYIIDLYAGRLKIM